MNSNLKALINHLKQEREIIRFLITFYSVGVAGIALPFSSKLFVALTPLALLMSFGLMLLHHRAAYNTKTILVFGLIFALGLTAEIIGVQTGVIFGDYFYGKNLGYKIFDTPLLIGINWLLLIYLSASIVEKLRISAFLKIILSSCIMIGYDLILEQIAPKMDMWSWRDDIIPIQNYTTWFVLSLVFHSALKIFNIKTDNPIARTLLLSQFFFFVVLYFIL